MLIAKRVHRVTARCGLPLSRNFAVLRPPCRPNAGTTSRCDVSVVRSRSRTLHMSDQAV